MLSFLYVYSDHSILECYNLFSGVELSMRSFFVITEEDKLPEDGLYQYLLPGEEHDDQRHRATDRVLSKKTYRLRKVMEDAGNRVMYYLKDGPERAFVSEELMLIPEDTELPPGYVQEW